MSSNTGKIRARRYASDNEEDLGFTNNEFSTSSPARKRIRLGGEHPVVMGEGQPLEEKIDVDPMETDENRMLEEGAEELWKQLERVHMNVDTGAMGGPADPVKPKGDTQPPEQNEGKQGEAQFVVPVNAKVEWGVTADFQGLLLKHLKFSPHLFRARGEARTHKIKLKFAGVGMGSRKIKVKAFGQDALRLKQLVKKHKYDVSALQRYFDNNKEYYIFNVQSEISEAARGLDED